MALAGTTLITKYRPATWSEVVGHKAEVASLRDAAVNRTAQAFLFSGKPGTGKTTLMRLTAKAFGADPGDVSEIPAAVYTGVDDMRSLTEGLRYRPISNEMRVTILDECHRLSKQAWDSLLQIVEHPPEWVLFGFCTTELQRVPAAIKRRCLAIDLKDVSKNDLVDFLGEIAEAEQLTVDKGVLDVCAREAGGSPGLALAHLSVCVQAKDRAEAASLLRSAETGDDADATAVLCRALLDGAPWEKLQPILLKLREVDPESVRYAVLGYLGKVLVEAKTAQRAAGIATLIEPFMTPFHHASDVPFAVCKVSFSQE